VTVYALNDQVSIPGRVRNFSLGHRVQTGSEVHPVSYPIRIAGSFALVKAVEA
jgi:hypothetical protein